MDGWVIERNEGITQDPINWWISVYIQGPLIRSRSLLSLLLYKVD